MSTDPVTVIITLREIYEKLVRVEKSVDAMAAEVPDHEMRLRALERRQWPLPVVAVVVSLGSLAIVVLPILVN